LLDIEHRRDVALHPFVDVEDVVGVFAFLYRPNVFLDVGDDEFFEVVNRHRARLVDLGVRSHLRRIDVCHDGSDVHLLKMSDNHLFAGIHLCRLDLVDKASVAMGAPSSEKPVRSHVYSVMSSTLSSA